MKRKYYYITIILLLFISCYNPKQKQGSDKQMNLIPELVPVDSFFQKQLEQIIFKSECFKKHQQDRMEYVTLMPERLYEHQQDRAIVFLFGLKKFNRNEFGISIHTCMQIENDSVLGGFYVNHNYKSYLFVVNKNITALLNMIKIQVKLLMLRNIWDW